MKVLPCRKGSRFCERCALSEQVSSFPFGHFGRGKSAQYKYLNCNDYIITYRFPSPVGCMSPPLLPIAPEETPLPDRAPERSPLRAARSAARPAQVRPLPVGSCRDNPPRGKLHREARTGKAHPGYALTGQTTSGRPPRGFSDSLRRELRRARRPAPQSLHK